jgi:transposase-like protein
VELTALRAVARAGYFAVQRDTIARRVGVVGIFPNEASIMRLIGASPGSGSWRQRQMNFQT